MKATYQEIETDSFKVRVRSISAKEQYEILYSKLSEYLAQTKHFKVFHKLKKVIEQENTHHAYFRQHGTLFKPNLIFYDKHDTSTYLSIQCDDRTLESIRKATADQFTQYLEYQNHDTSHNYAASRIENALHTILSGEYSKEETLKNIRDSLNAINLFFTELKHLEKKVKDLK